MELLLEMEQRLEHAPVTITVINAFRRDLAMYAVLYPVHIKAVMHHLQLPFAMLTQQCQVFKIQPRAR